MKLLDTTTLRAVGAAVLKPMPVSEYADGERTLEYVAGALFFLFLLLLFAAARFVDLDGPTDDKKGDGK